MLYSLCHQFIQLIIEGDELYTKIGKNVPPSESEGWTIVLMDRAAFFGSLVIPVVLVYPSFSIDKIIRNIN